MVEEAAVPAPQEFSKKIDMLKELYNKLGAQITESKSRLERALLTARELQNDLAALAGWLDGLGGLGQQTLELEMSRMQAIRDKLNANYEDFAQNCDPTYLNKLREQIEEINSRWEQLKKHGVVKRGNDIDELTRWLRDVEARLAGAAPGTPALRVLGAELRARTHEVRAADCRALSKLYDRVRDQLTVSHERVTWWGALFYSLGIISFFI